MSDVKVYVEPGDTFSVVLPWSEVCLAMRVAETRMTCTLGTGDWPSVQLWKDGRRFSGPITTGEAGLYRDDAGRFYAYGVVILGHMADRDVPRFGSDEYAA